MNERRRGITLTTRALEPSEDRGSQFEGIGNRLFELDPNIRHVAVNRGDRIVEMGQNPKWPSYNAVDTDRMEELIVNPAILELARRRGDIDLHGIRYVVIR
jgi:hypothetical protein